MPEELKDLTLGEIRERAIAADTTSAMFRLVEELYQRLHEALRRSVSELEEKVQPMNTQEQRAFDWAMNQQYQSVAATYARALAQYIKRVRRPR